MWMSTRLLLGEGRADREEIGMRTCSIYRGNGHGTLERDAGNRGRPA